MDGTERLENLDLTGPRVAVRSFQNLIYHRTVILEGIRRIAMRNMVHLSDAREHCDAHATSPDEDDWIPRVQARMLGDQGLENNRLNRAIIGQATFAPMRVYLAVLYEEIRCVQRWRGKSSVFENDNFFSYLDGQEEAIARLKDFRDSLLHPRPTSLEPEMAFLAHGDSYNAAPALQAAIDEYLAGANQKLLASLNGLISR